jgi:MGT family glycosyltransferase
MDMNKPIVAFCMGGTGHVQALLPVVAGLCGRNKTVYVLSDSEFRGKFESVGARFLDLYHDRSIEAVDNTSRPIPSRYVTFAAAYADNIARQVAELDPAFILYDLFAVVGSVVARALNLPYISVCPNHAPVPVRVLESLRHDPRVATSEACLRAVSHLRNAYGITNASPFSYTDNLSPYLNVYGEPEEFLTADDRTAFEPIAFYGVLLPPANQVTKQIDQHNRKIYVSFGTVVWWYFSDRALAALKVITEVFSKHDVELFVGLGGQTLSDSARKSLEAPNVRLIDYADQYRMLANADAFITHHGLNSTHEAIFQEVPMLSYPFFGDQPALAHRCQELGLALALGTAPQAPLDPEQLNKAWQRIIDQLSEFRKRLAEARRWEQRTIDSREMVLDRILSI